MEQNAHFPITEPLRAFLREGLDELLKQPSDDMLPGPCLEQLRLLLEALPLDTTEFSLAVNRLANTEQEWKGWLRTILRRVLWKAANGNPPGEVSLNESSQRL
jgi:hypothetical protein